MKYVLLIQMPDENADPQAAGEEAAQAVMTAYQNHMQSLKDKGVWLGGEALEGAELTTQVSVRDGEVLVVDGPLVETTEQVVGYYLVDCRDLDEAIAIGAGIPATAMGGTIEVRPVWDYESQIR